MTETLPGVHFSESTESQRETYRGVSALAVVTLLGGVASWTALLHPNLWAVPAATLLVGLVALRRIAHSAGTLIGRKLALAGLALALLCGAAAVTSWSAYRWYIVHEAQRVAQQWFADLAAGQPQKAHALSLHTIFRPSPGQEWEFYRTHPRERAGLEQFVKSDLARTLLALGKRAQVRYYGREGILVDPTDADQVVLVYAVTFDDAEGKKKTFFVGMTLNRLAYGPARPQQWMTDSITAPFRPKRWK